MSDKFLKQDGVKALLEANPSGECGGGAEVANQAGSSSADQWLGQDEVDAMLMPFPLAVAHHGKTEREFLADEKCVASTRFAQMALDPAYGPLVREYAEFRYKALLLGEKYGLSLESVLANIRK